MFTFVCSSCIRCSSLTPTCYSGYLCNRLGSPPVCAPPGGRTCYPRNRFSCSAWHLSLPGLLLSLSPYAPQEFYVPCCKIQYGFFVEGTKIPSCLLPEKECSPLYRNDIQRHTVRCLTAQSDLGFIDEAVPAQHLYLTHLLNHQVCCITKYEYWDFVFGTIETSLKRQNSHHLLGSYFLP